MNLDKALKEGISDVLGPYLSSNGKKSAKEKDNKKSEFEDFSICRYLRGIRDGYWENAAKEQKMFEEAKKYSSDVGSEGGALIHPQIQQQIVPLIRKKAIFRQLGPEVITLANTNTLEMRRQSSSTEAYWIGDSEDIEDQMGDDDEVSWGSLDLKLKTVGSFARLPNTLIEDSSPSADRIITNDIAKVIGLAEDSAFMFGSGGKAPLGLYYRDEIDSIDLDATITFDALINAQTAIENAGGEYNIWLINPTMRGLLRKLKDNDDRYIWTQGDVSKDEPDTLLGIPVKYTRQIGTSIPNANRTCIILGQVDSGSYMIIQKKNSLRMASSTEAAGAFENNETVFRGLRRVDGGPRIPENFHIIKNIHTA